MDAQYQRMVALLNGLQMLARADAGALPQTSEIDISALVDERTRSARGRHLTVTYSLSDNLEGAVVTGWRDGLGLALDNLLDNAALHGRPDGHVEVEVEVEAQIVDIKVGDDGQGIAEKDRERLALWCARGDNARHPGSGLGLALVEQQAALHGGSLTLARSEAGGLLASMRLRTSEVRVS